MTVCNCYNDLLWILISMSYAVLSIRRQSSNTKRFRFFLSQAQIHIGRWHQPKFPIYNTQYTFKETLKYNNALEVFHIHNICL